MLSYVGLAQTVGLVSGANMKQKNHLGMKVFLSLRNRSGFKGQR